MKKKILMLAVAACLIVLSIASSSLAYFTDTDAKQNVFTAGKVDIALTYEPYSGGKVFPGQTVANPATITLATDSEDAYVGAIIKLSGTAITDILDTTDDTNNIPAYVKSLFDLPTSGIATEATFDSQVGAYFIYVVFTNKLSNTADTTKTATIFNNVQIPAEWDHAQMNIFSNVTIEITAYATQTVFTTQSGIDTAAEALAAAFPGIW